jgi:CRP/FNR family transcriptional regulator
MTAKIDSSDTFEIKQLLQFVDRRFIVKKDSFLHQEGMDAEEVYIILSGKILIGKITSDGRELTLRICSKNDICGELTLFTDHPKYLLNAKAIEDSEVAAIRKDFLEVELLHNSALAFEYMKWVSDHARKTQTKFRDLILNGKKGALYSTLIRMSNSYGVKKPEGIIIDLPLTNQELANFCGTSRESTNRILNELKRDSIISIKKGKIIIHDIQYLRREIDCENCPVAYCSID